MVAIGSLFNIYGSIYIYISLGCFGLGERQQALLQLRQRESFLTA